MAKQFRAKAAEYRQQIGQATEPSAIREFEELERSFTELADNAAWLADNSDKTLHAGENDVGYYAGLATLRGASLAEEAIPISPSRRSIFFAAWAPRSSCSGILCLKSCERNSLTTPAP
jgi:hypothetical protein